MFQTTMRIAAAIAVFAAAIGFVAQAQARAPIPGGHTIVRLPPHVWDGGQWHWPTGTRR
jgi:hypothetical protein